MGVLLYQAVQKVHGMDSRQLKLILTQKHNLTKKELEMRLINALTNPAVTAQRVEPIQTNVVYLQDYLEQSL
jgi:hypothetical protein